jgi:hypothetical protein
MSQENVELVRRGIASADTFWALLDEDVVLDTRNYPGLDIYGTPVVVGRKAVIDYTRPYWGTWDDYHLEAEELFDAGSSVVGVVRERGRGKGGGVPFDRRGPRYGPSVEAGSSGGSTTPTRPRHSKPWGCGSSRCRRRTSPLFWDSSERRPGRDS